MEDLVEHALANPDRMILSLQMFASVGYICNGFQCIATSSFSQGRAFFELITIERITRDMAALAPNVYFLDLFACCREVFNDFSITVDR